MPVKTKAKDIKRYKKGTSRGGEFAPKDIGGGYPPHIVKAIKASKAATAQRVRVYKLKKKLGGMDKNNPDYAATKKHVAEQSAKFDEMNSEAKALRFAAKKTGYSVNVAGNVTKSPGAGTKPPKPKDLKAALKQKQDNAPSSVVGENKLPKSMSGMKVVGKSVSGDVLSDGVNQYNLSRFSTSKAKATRQAENAKAADAVGRAMGVPSSEISIVMDEKGKPVGILSMYNGERKKVSVGKNEAAVAKHAVFEALVNGSGTTFNEGGKIINAGATDAFDSDPSKWGDNPGSLWKNAKSMGIGGDTLNKEIGNTLKNRSAILAATPKKHRSAMRKRLDALAEAYDLHNTMRADGFSEEYSMNFTGHVIRQRAVIDFPKGALKQNEYQRHILQNEGVDFGGYRNPLKPGGTTTTIQFRDYLDAEIAPHTAASIINDTLIDQGGSSWSTHSVTYKTFLFKNMDTGDGGVFWGHKHSGALDNHEYNFNIKTMAATPAIYEDTMTAMHAYTYNALKAAKMPDSVRGSKPGTLIVQRTSTNREFAKKSHLPGIIGTKKGGDLTDKDNYGIAKGNAMFESHAAFEAGGFGDNLHFREAPYHRVLAHYALIGQVDSNTSQSPFFGDRENEVLVIPNGLKTVVVNDNIVKKNELEPYHLAAARKTFADESLWKGK